MTETAGRAAGGSGKPEGAPDPVQAQLAAAAQELADALQQQAASSEILRLIRRSPRDLQTVFETLCERAVNLCKADHGRIVHFDPNGGRYRDVAEFGVADDAYRQLNQSRRYQDEGRETVAGRAILERRPVAIDDVLADPEYRSPYQQVAGFRSILGLPLLRDDFVIGVIIVWRQEAKPFTEREISILQGFADQAVIAIENVELFQALQRQTEELSRYLSPQVVAAIASERGDQLLIGHRRNIAVMFCDLRGFTSLSETEDPEEVFGVLNEYHDEMGMLIEMYGGTLAYFAGDGMMVFFNDPTPTPGFELEAVRAALTMRTRFAGLATSWQKRGYDLRLGIGMSLGYATLGRIGSQGRYHYDAVGSVVNNAARLSDEAHAGQILITQRLYAAVEAEVKVEAMALSLKGLTRPITAYSVVEPVQIQSPALPVTRRELEVARLVAEGLRNREIASRLFVSERTVDNHVQHLLNRLNFQSRAQIATWVTRIPADKDEHKK